MKTDPSPPGLNDDTPAGDPLAPLPEIDFLVQAAAQALPAATPPRAEAPAPPSRSLEGRVVWMLELFERQAAQRALR